MLIKTLFISDRLAEFHSFIRNNGAVSAGMDLLTHIEANRRHQFQTYYDLFILDLHDPWLAIPPWMREQAQQHYFHQYLFISDTALSPQLEGLLGRRIYKVIPFKTAKESLPQIVRELSARMEEHRYHSAEPIAANGNPFGLLGNHPSIRRINEFINLVSKARFAPCLISGETGTGKNLCARLIHQANDLHDDLFFVKECENATTFSLVGDLFGVQEHSDVYGPKRKGLLELYRGGTLVLNNVEKLPPEVQDKLLFYLEDRVIKPIGGTTPVKSNVRIIGITQHNLEWFVKKQNFNSDLFYHLNAFEIALPPLRDRQEDVLLLSHYFRQYYNYLFGKNILKFNPQAEQLLKEYKWPGNVRELKDTIERAIFIANAQEITSQEIPEFLKNTSASSSPVEDIIGNCSMREMEKLHIGRVLTYTSGNKSRAANILEISRTTLREKIRQYGLEV